MWALRNPVIPHTITLRTALLHRIGDLIFPDSNDFNNFDAITMPLLTQGILSLHGETNALIYVVQEKKAGRKHIRGKRK